MSGAEALRQARGGGTTAANGAYRLQQRPEATARIEEPKQAIAEQAQAATTDRAAAVAAEVKIEAEVRQRVRTLETREQPTRERVPSELALNVGEAKQKGDRGSISRALELIGKEIGMFVEREMAVKSPLERLDANQLVALRSSPSSEGCVAGLRSPWGLSQEAAPRRRPAPRRALSTREPPRITPASKPHPTRSARRAAVPSARPAAASPRSLPPRAWPSAARWWA